MLLTSESGKGSTFAVYFPRIVEQEDGEAEEAQPLQTGRGRILVVDDEVDIVNAVKIILEQSGYTVSTFTNSLDAWNTFQADPGAFDLIISDLTMPRMTGLELAKNMLASRPDLPIIICTGFTETVSAEKASALGIREVILKPIIPRNLMETIGKLLPNQPGDS